jgi:hypothetical protein
MRKLFYGTKERPFKTINKVAQVLEAWKEFHGWDINGGMARITGKFDPDSLQLSLAFETASQPKQLPGPFRNLLKGYVNVNIDPRIFTE